MEMRKRDMGKRRDGQAKEGVIVGNRQVVVGEAS